MSAQHTQNGAIIVQDAWYNKGERQWECPRENTPCSCGKSCETPSARCSHKYRNKSELVTHMQGHHGSGTELVCRNCCSPKQFQCLSNLRRHEKSCKHGMRTSSWTCPECGAEHARSDNLKRHLKSRHQKTAEEADAVLGVLRDERGRSRPSTASRSRSGTGSSTGANAGANITAAQVSSGPSLVPQQQQQMVSNEVSPPLPAFPEPSMWDSEVLDLGWFHSVPNLQNYNFGVVGEPSVDVSNMFDNAASGPVESPYQPADALTGHGQPLAGGDTFLTCAGDVSELTGVFSGTAPVDQSRGVSSPQEAPAQDETTVDEQFDTLFQPLREFLYGVRVCGNDVLLT